MRLYTRCHHLLVKLVLVWLLISCSTAYETAIEGKGGPDDRTMRTEMPSEPSVIPGGSGGKEDRNPAELDPERESEPERGSEPNPQTEPESEPEPELEPEPEPEPEIEPEPETEPEMENEPEPETEPRENRT